MMINGKLLLFLKENRISQEELGKKLGISHTMVSHVVRGRWNLTPEEKRKWAAALEKQVEEIF